MKLKNVLPLAVLVSFLVCSAPMLAHHGEAAYDLTKRITVKGTISSFQFVNPHVQIFFDSADDRGKSKTWVGEAASPNLLVREGWDRNSLKPGDHIIAVGRPAKKGTNLIYLEKLVLSNGQEISPRWQWER